MTQRRYQSALLQLKGLCKTQGVAPEVFQDWFTQEVRKVLAEDGIAAGDKIVPLTIDGHPEYEKTGFFVRLEPNGPYPRLVCHTMDEKGNETDTEFNFTPQERGYPFVVPFELCIEKKPENSNG